MVTVYINDKKLKKKKRKWRCEDNESKFHVTEYCYYIWKI